MNNEQVLICDNNQEWAKSLGESLSNSQYSAQYVHTGKEIQKDLYNNSELTTLIMCWGVKEHGPLEVLRFIKTVAPSLRVFLIFESQSEFEESELTTSQIQKLGVTNHFVKPMSHQKISSALKGGQKFDTWKDGKEAGEFKESVEEEIDDREFTRIKIKSFAMGARTVFDHYIKLGKSKYLKILHRGETFSIDRVKKYAHKEIEYLYFKSTERSEYINYLNSLIKKSASKASLKVNTKLKMTQTGSELLVEEIYQEGLSPSLYKESKDMTEGVYETLKDNPEIYTHIRNLVSEDPNAYSKAYLTSLFSGMICLQIPWAGKKTSNIVGQASFLIDLGLLKIPPTERDLDPSIMKPEELQRFRDHPNLSLDLIKAYRFIPDTVRNVIRDHHEYVNGEGFPRGISGAQIYPLAKIVAFASEFSEYILKNKLNPQEGIKELLIKKGFLHRFDADVIKCFISSLMQKELTKKVSSM
jgi:response regulator RpfG family c-di-GMP phosphodiesterase